MRTFNESKYVDKDIEPLGKKLSHHSDDGFIDFCTAKVLDDLNKGNKEKLDFFDFWDWAAEVGSKDIVELIYNDFKNGKLSKDSAVNKFYNIYADIKDLSLKDPKKFIKQYGWAYKDKIKDKSLKEERFKHCVWCDSIYEDDWGTPVQSVTRHLNNNSKDIAKFCKTFDLKPRDNICPDCFEKCLNELPKRFKLEYSKRDY